MGNNSTQNSKLDEAVKDSLNNYEAKYDAGDWARMERMLDATPKTSVSNFPYGKIGAIAGAVILGSFLVYKAVHTSPSTDATSEKQTITTPGSQPEKQTAAPAVTPSVTSTAPAGNTSPALVNPSGNTVPPPAVSQPKPDMTAKVSSEKDKAMSQKEIDAEYNKHQKVTVMGNEPIWPDMIDSSKGVIHETKESESMKKKAKTKGGGNIGLNALANFHMNLDSLNKYNESQKKDTVH
jgi:hypothetical protein